VDNASHLTPVARYTLVLCPQVHAFNCLRCVFNDAALALDTSGFHAAGVAAAIRGMAADAWEVRCCCCCGA
jgi:hypothetical protein